jgi:hypothetical protein
MLVDAHHFEFDLDRAILGQALGKLDASPMLPFEKNVGPDLSGVYVLYYQGELVYIGKASKGTTKSERSLRQRLNEHVGKLSKYVIDLDKMGCRYLTFESEWWVWAAEFALINHFKPPWNGSGYGSKTPGVGRPGTGKVSRFAEMFSLRSSEAEESETSEEGPSFWDEAFDSEDDSLIPDESHT